MRAFDTALEHRDGDRLVLVDTLVPNGKQNEFFHVTELPYRVCEEVLFDGSIRAGKTQAAVKKIVAWAMKTGGTYVISRFSYRELEDSTKKVCLYGEGGLPPAIPHQLLLGGSLEKAKNETHNKVKLRNGAEILFRALEPKERGKIRNVTACGWFIDQAEELDGETQELEDFYQEIKGRCSDPRGPRKLLLVANPGPTDHLLYNRFIDPVTRYDRARRVHVNILDNRENLPADYVDMLLRTEHTNPDYFKRMVMGEWGAFGGKRFKCWNRKLHVCEPFDIPAGWDKFEGGDYGWANPTAWLWATIAYNSRIYIVAEHRASETGVAEHAKVIKMVRAGHEDVHKLRPFEGDLEPSATWFDPTAFNKRGEHDSVAVGYQEEDIYVARAVNDRLGGWERMEKYMTTILDDGYPKLQIFSNCEGLIKELPNLRIKEGTDDVEKVNDHSADATRYVLMSRQPTPTEQAQEEEGTREAATASLIKRLSDPERSLQREHVYEGG